MRKFKNKYDVSYMLCDINNIIILNRKNADCYGHLFSSFEITNKVIVYDFICNTTELYSKKYIEKLGKIHNFKIKFIDDNKIEINNISSLFLLKSFLTMFRILFENYNKISSKENVKLLNSFINNKCKIKDLLKRFLYYYNQSEIFQGYSHGLKKVSNKKLKLKTKKELINYKPDSYNQIHSFYDN